MNTSQAIRILVCWIILFCWINETMCDMKCYRTHISCCLQFTTLVRQSVWFCRTICRNISYLSLFSPLGLVSLVLMPVSTYRMMSFPWQDFDCLIGPFICTYVEYQQSVFFKVITEVIFLIFFSGILSLQSSVRAVRRISPRVWRKVWACVCSTCQRWRCSTEARNVEMDTSRRESSAIAEIWRYVRPHAYVLFSKTYFMQTFTCFP